jgi:hypothetical protein
MSLFFSNAYSGLFLFLGQLFHDPGLFGLAYLFYLIILHRATQSYDKESNNITAK